ncbi:DUF6031 family protein [Streptomyces sp. NPDC006393]|uniref:DUF6031 family protein n=1 Tax=Streptomyces sp. NPDC006393 TaxID=3156763 RepID=UPI0033C06C3D
MTPDPAGPAPAPTTAVRTARDIAVLPAVRAGHSLPAARAVEAWTTAAWLMLAEGRAYAEDLQGGTAQPQMQQAAKLRFLEQLADIDNRLAGREPVADEHCLAMALEYGLRELVDATGEQLADIFALHEEFGADTCHVDGVFALWERLLEAFPGELPDRLVAEGQRDMLCTLRVWARLARAVGLDIGFLATHMKAA